jgi:hypothetical protein
LETAALAVVVVLLLVAVAQIYQTQLAQAPRDFKGHIEIEGGATANPPAMPAGP